MHGDLPKTMVNSCSYPSTLFYVDASLPCKTACGRHVFRSLTDVIEEVNQVPQDRIVTIILYPGIHLLPDPVILKHPHVIVSAYIAGTAFLDGILIISDSEYRVPEGNTILIGIALYSVKSQIRYELVTSSPEVSSQTHTIQQLSSKGIDQDPMIEVHSKTRSKTMFQIDQLTIDDQQLQLSGPAFLRVTKEPDISASVHVLIRNAFVQIGSNHALMEMNGVDIIQLLQSTVSVRNKFPPYLLLMNDIKNEIDISDCAFSCIVTSVLLSVLQEGNTLSTLRISNVQADAGNFLSLEGGRHGLVRLINCLVNCTNYVLLHRTTDQGNKLIRVSNSNLFTTNRATLFTEKCSLIVENSTISSTNASRSEGSLTITDSTLVLVQSTVICATRDGVRCTRSDVSVDSSHLQGGRRAIFVIDCNPILLRNSSLTGQTGIEMTTATVSPVLTIEGSYFQSSTTAISSFGQNNSNVVMKGSNTFGSQTIAETPIENPGNLTIEYFNNRNFPALGITPSTFLGKVFPAG